MNQNDTPSPPSPWPSGKRLFVYGALALFTVGFAVPFIVWHWSGRKFTVGPVAGLTVAGLVLFVIVGALLPAQEPTPKDKERVSAAAKKVDNEKPSKSAKDEFADTEPVADEKVGSRGSADDAGEVSEKAKAAEEAAEAAQAKLEAKAEKAEAKRVAEAKKASAKSRKLAKKQAAYTRFEKKFYSITRPADAAMKRYQSAMARMGTGDLSIYEAYVIVDEVKDEQDKARTALTLDIDVPKSLSKKHRKKLNEALQSIRISYDKKGNAMGHVLKFMDEQKPSEASQATKDLEVAKSYMYQAIVPLTEVRLDLKIKP